MKLFLVYLLLTFFAGVAAWKVDRKKRDWVLLLFCLGLAFSYFFLNKI